jgi:hypothetical protein
MNYTRIFLDTCVLLNYIQVPFEPDRGSNELLGRDDLTRVIGSVVYEELENRRSVRTQVYLDLLCVAESLDLDSGDMTVPIYEFEARDVDLPNDDLKVTNHDLDHIEDLQWDLVGADDQDDLNDRISDLREKIRYMKARRREVDAATERFEKEYNNQLADAIEEVIFSRQDAAVLAQTVAWKYDNRDIDPVPEIIVTLDSKDMLSKESEINTAIRDEYSVGSTISIKCPEDILNELT